MPTEKISCLEKSPVAGASDASEKHFVPPSASAPQFGKFVIALALLLVCFSVPLFQLFQFALGSELYSYVVLMPVVTVYLIQLQKKKLPALAAPAKGLAVLYFIGGAVLLAGYFAALRAVAPWSIQDKLALSISSCFLFYLGTAAFTLGKKTFSALAFPLAILIFMIPMPVRLMTGVETFLQYGSAMVADWMYRAARTPEVLTNLTFHLPGGGITVAPECSGIHSSLILFITSILAGYMFLRSPWHRAILAFCVLPLALLRNGFRVFTIGELCVHIDWTMIDSPIHHQGGPIFFLLSLIPFFLLLVLLYKLEHRKAKSLPANI